MLQELVLKFLLASALGGLIGLEREWGRDVEKRQYFMGVRTSILISVFGFLSYLLGTNMLIAGLIITFGIGSIAYFVRFEKTGAMGLTTLISMLVVYLIGSLVLFNQFFATIITIVVLSILFFKNKIHGVIYEISEKEIRAGVEFLILALVILPLLPNHPIDYFKIFNPFQYWYIVVLISLISFISYIFLKKYSSKGILYSGFFGGLINSAATSYLISKYRGSSKGVLIAIAASIVSDIIGIGLIVGNWNILIYTLPAQIVGILILSFSSLRMKDSRVKLKLGSPLSLKSSLEFATLLFVLMMATVFLKNYSVALILVVVLASLYSSTAMSLSIAAMNLNGAIDIHYSAALIILATIICLLSKNIWVIKANHSDRRKVLIWTAITSIVMAAVGVVSYGY